MTEPTSEMDNHRSDETAPLLGPEEEAQTFIGAKPANVSWVLPYEGFAWRSVALGVIIGSIVCLTNIHFGLKTGYINIMSMPSALIGFGAFELVKKHLEFPFSPAENVLIQTVASSVGAIPATAGLVGVIPALEFLTSPADGGPAKTTLLRLCIWSLGISAFGLMFAVILRERVILKDRLRFPTGTATALMVNVLHNEKGTTTSHSEISSQSSAGSESGTSFLDAEELRPQDDTHVDQSIKPQTMTTHFVPIFHNIPLFGAIAYSKWLWSFNCSLGYVG
ncbi:OPT-domain-containing protein [Melanomma pulvis-pyrius CBS 109.77]|uniref:OPT-domain-containing protein n=1 Tax=Melanomma pulvis-pyrius CBS 109.77 TaxID=1314802 RepID=A0A6A6XBS2_9PLEO|nr:OPT-domain-containing protein [Melanomma pulvis-pyrius CBS 109.77]